ncbi:MAG: PEP-CTERM sorting domain-containing protein [Isosphaeraceae bacterium]
MMRTRDVIVSAPVRRRPALGLVTIAALLLLGSTRIAHGDVILDMIVENATVTPGGTSSFDVVLQNDVTSTANAVIGGFSIDLTIPVSTGVTLTAVDDAATSTYIFTGNSFGFIGTVVSSTEITANDLANSGGTTLTPGEIFGLAHISFAVAAGTPDGMVPVSLIGYPDATSLSDDQGNPLAFTIVNGEINVIPEPSSLVLLLTAAVAGVGCRWFHRKTQIRGGRTSA